MNKKKFLEKNNCILSGECIIGVLGQKTNLIDILGNNLFVGDIVIFYDNDYSSQGISVVVNHKYKNSTDGINNYVEVEDEDDFFIMGLKSIDFTNNEKYDDDNTWKWAIKRVKSYKEVIHGEHWKDFGFNYSIKNKKKL